ncbi:hypothetical protein ACFCV3_11770 [Kribbella sp. NPDC056345]|uniref:hypothetical protein n=1 Tax=Kribbella sp. NPDC056345 TaxID=3345789 RepID=UPI0035D5F200
MIVAGVGFFGHDRSNGTAPDPVSPTTTSRSPKAQAQPPEAIQAALLPDRLGSLAKVADLTVPAPTGENVWEGYAATQPGDEVRIAYLCKRTNAPAEVDPYVLPGQPVSST